IADVLFKLSEFATGIIHPRGPRGASQLPAKRFVLFPTAALVLAAATTVARLVAAQPRRKDHLTHPVRSFLAQGETHRQPFRSPTRMLDGGPPTSAWASLSWTVDALTQASGRISFSTVPVHLVVVLHQECALSRPFLRWGNLRRAPTQRSSIPTRHYGLGPEPLPEDSARLSGWIGHAPAQETRSGSRGFPADNIVSFNHRGHAHPRAAVFHSALDTHHFAQGSDKHLRTMRDLRGKCQGDVQL